MVTTKGDANNIADDPVDKRISRDCGNGYSVYRSHVNFLKSTVGMILLITAAFLLTELSFHKQKKRDYQDIDAIKGKSDDSGMNSHQNQNKEKAGDEQCVRNLV